MEGGRGQGVCKERNQEQAGRIWIYVVYLSSEALYSEMGDVRCYRWGLGEGLWMAVNDLGLDGIFWLSYNIEYTFD